MFFHAPRTVTLPYEGGAAAGAGAPFSPYMGMAAAGGTLDGRTAQGLIRGEGFEQGQDKKDDKYQQDQTDENTHACRSFTKKSKLGNKNFLLLKDFFDVMSKI